MRIVTRIAPTGHFVEDVLLPDVYPLPADCIESRPPAGMNWPRWVNGAWVDANAEYAHDDNGALMVPGGSYVTTKRDAEIAGALTWRERWRICRKLYLAVKNSGAARTWCVNNGALTQAEANAIVAAEWAP